VVVDDNDEHLEEEPAGGRVEVAATRHGREVELALSDTGEGIPTELLERVFERFWRPTAPARTPPTPAAAAAA
jgi:signal transduction histidine kinase